VGNCRTLERLADLAAAYGVATTLLGGGSNILVSDAGVSGLVIANQCRAIYAGDLAPLATDFPELIDVPRPLGSSTVRVIAEAGALLAGLARWAIRSGWSGLEWAVSVPGTVGGAVIGNAGAHGGEIADDLAWALVADPGQGRRVLHADQLGFAYRTSSLKRGIAERLQDSGSLASPPGPVVLAAAFDLVPGDTTEMTARANEHLARRRASQPVEPSAGSIFRNPAGDFAGRLVDAAGLKGHRLGGAQVSPRHANFIVNTGDARAADVIGLIELIRARVHAQFGTVLTPEILFVGKWNAQPPYTSLHEK
jgi:UDP-N-acetylmuramate dehydrogenase